MRTIALAAFLMAFFSVASISFAGSAVGIWHLDEGSGTTAFDSSGNGLDGTIYNSNWVEGISGTALELDGSTSSIVVPDNDKLGGFSQMTIEAWVKSDTFGPWNRGRSIVSKTSGDPSHDDDYGLQAYDHDLLFYARASDGSYLFVGRAYIVINDNAWHKIEAVWDGKKYYIYLDGDVVVSGTSKSGTVSNGNAPLEIGKMNGWSWTYFDGKIDEVAIYDYAKKSCNCEELKEDVDELESQLSEASDRIGDLEEAMEEYGQSTEEIEEKVGILESLVHTVICKVIPKGFLAASGFDLSYCE